MRFCVECNLVTDEFGKAAAAGKPTRIGHTIIEASDAEEVILEVVRNDGTEVLGTIHQVEQIQAVATVRRGKSAMMLHAYPEEEAAWRMSGE